MTLLVALLCYTHLANAQLNLMLDELDKASSIQQKAQILIADKYALTTGDTLLLRKAIQISDEVSRINGYDNIKGKYYSLKGTYYFRKGLIDSAIYNFQKAIDNHKIYDNFILLARDLGGLANMWGQKGNLEKKLFYLDSALLVTQKLKDQSEIRISLSLDKGNTFLQLKNEIEFLKIYKSALKEIELSENVNDKKLFRVKANAYTNLGAYYFSIKPQTKLTIDTGLNFSKKALYQARLAKDSRQTAGIYLNLGNALKGKINLRYLDSAKAIYNQIGDVLGSTRVLILLAEKAYLNNNYKKSIQLSNEVLTMANKNGYADLRLFALKLLSQNYQALDDHKKALVYQNREDILKDSLQGIDFEKRIARIEGNYQIKQKDNEILLLQKNEALLKQKQNFTAWIVVVISLGIFIITFILINGYRIKKKLVEAENINLETSLKQNKLESENLQLLLAKQSKDLASQVIGLSEKREFTLKLIKLIDEQESKGNHSDDILKMIKRKLSSGSSESNQLNDFLKLYSQQDPDFFERIRSIAKDISPRELRLLAFIKIGMSTKEIAAVLHVEPDTIKVSRYRLKKKLFPNSDLSIEQLLQSL